MLRLCLLAALCAAPDASAQDTADATTLAETVSSAISTAVPEAGTRWRVAPAPVPVAPKPNPPPLVEREAPPFEPRFGFLVLRAIPGELIGALPGGLIALVASFAQCENGEGWVSGFTCEAGVGFAVTIGAFAGVPLGAALGMHLAASDRGYEGNVGWAILAAYAGLAIGAGVSAIIIETMDTPTLGAAMGGITTVILSTLFASWAYRAGVRPGRRAGGERALVLPQLALDAHGAALGLWGAW